MPTIQNLIDKIKAELSNQKSSTIPTYTGQWSPPPSAPANPNAPLSSIPDDGSSSSPLGDIAKYAVYSKWHSDSGTGHALKIKGREMVKSVTGLDPE
jgi:hypothetical protein